MRIRQAGNNRLSAEIDRLRFRGLKFFRVRIRTDKNNSVALHRDRFRARLPLAHRVNVAVHKNGWGRFGADYRGTEPEKNPRSENFHRAAIIPISPRCVERATLERESCE